MSSSTFLSLASSIQKVPLKHTTEDFVALYALHQQATEGCNTSIRPPKFDVLGNDRWVAWNDLKGLSQQDAEQRYIELAKSVLAKEGRLMETPETALLTL